FPGSCMIEGCPIRGETARPLQRRKDCSRLDWAGSMDHRSQRSSGASCACATLVGVSQAKGPLHLAVLDAESVGIDLNASAAQKVALFRERFRGRGDVYAKLWANTRTPDTRQPAPTSG